MSGVGVSSLRVPPVLSFRISHLLLAILLMVFGLSACESQSDDPLDGDADGDEEGWKVMFHYDGETYPVNIDKQETVQHPDESGDVPVVRLDVAYEAAGLDIPAASLWFNFEGDDGFGPLDSSNCTGLVPVSGEILGQGYFEIDTHRLGWDAELGFPNCMKVKNIAHVWVSGTPDIPNPDGDDPDGDDPDGDDPDGDDPDGDDPDGDDPDGDDPDGDDPDGDDPDGDEETPWAIIFRYDGTDYPVDVTELTTMTYNDGTSDLTVAQLSSAFVASGITADVDSLLFNFEAEDGFGPLDSSNCEGLVPVEGDILDKGYLNLANNRLIWDASLAFPGCMSVRDLALVLVEDAPPLPWVVTFRYDGTDYPVTVDELETITYSTGSEDLTVVALSTAFTASGITADVESLQFNFEAADGYKPEDSANCVGLLPVDGAILAQGYLNPAITRLIWDATLDFPGCMNLRDIAVVHAEDKPWNVIFHYDGTEYPVNVRGLETVTRTISDEEVTVVLLSTAFTASGITADLDSLQFNFEASDGYDPADSANCVALVPVAGDVFDSGYLRLDITRLVWDATLAYPGCLRVTNLAHVRAEDKPE